MQTIRRKFTDKGIQPDLQFTGLRYSALCPSSAKSATPKIATTRQAATEMDFRNLPARSREQGTGLQNGDLAGILFTTYPTAAQALQNLYRQFDPAPTPQIQELVQLITEGCQSNSEKITRIQQYIQTELSDCPLSLSETGFRFRPSAEVIRTAYGTGIEKVNLMTNLLRAAGIKAALQPLIPSLRKQTTAV